ncbi:hypothetical protein [Bacillus sp. TE8-1]|uniref:hypothetical protein n=1 Tax=Bacillus sp. TE8-1 TaxID=2217829 RepID=UPI0011ECBF77|nr:hypothetical protein [Bacillus sp. TE8-1]KAA0780961.1 hypothetical protein DN404_00615 [Bacillus sp. TE8-1]
MILENVSTIGALAFLFLMIYLADPKDVSLLTIPAYFGGIWVTHWLTENGFQGTFIYTSWLVIYIVIMIYLFFASIRLGIRNIKYIKEKIRKRRSIKK